MEICVFMTGGGVGLLLLLGLWLGFRGFGLSTGTGLLNAMSPPTACLGLGTGLRLRLGLLLGLSLLLWL